MTRPADPESKTKHNQIVCKPGREPTMKAFRSVCAKDGLDMSDELYGLIEGWLTQHNWPPGNPQLDLGKFMQPPPLRPLCIFHSRGWCPPNIKLCSHRKSFNCLMDVGSNSAAAKPVPDRLWKP